MFLHKIGHGFSPCHRRPFAALVRRRGTAACQRHVSGDALMAENIDCQSADKQPASLFGVVLRGGRTFMAKNCLFVF